ncbi:MAG: shikimate kinase, partial [Erysipelotrichales bacterium]
KVMILGSGASSKLVQQYFKDKEIIIISRSDEYYNYNNIDLFSADLLVNTTPIGMNEDKSPLNDVSNYKGIIDLNYNPLNSKLKMQALKANIPFVGGIDMLVVQAIKSFEIWHCINISESVYQEVLLEVLLKLNNKIVLIGMPLSGKTTLVKRYNGVDLDAYVEENEQESIDRLLSNNVFREKENYYLKDLIQKDTLLIACGGGIVENIDNIILLKDYLIIYLEVPLDILKDRLAFSRRPLLKNIDELEKTYHRRKDKYINSANLIFDYNDVLVVLDKFIEII